MHDDLNQLCVVVTGSLDGPHVGVGDVAPPSNDLRVEEHLDARLLQRTTRSVTLTDAGARYLERAKRILSELAEAEGAARSERSIPTGRFVVTAPSVFGRMHVSPLMSDFLAKYPGVQGELGLRDRMAVVYPTTQLLSAKVRAFVELVTATRNWTFLDV